MPGAASFDEGTKTKPPEQKLKRTRPGRGRNLVRGQTNSRAGFAGALRTVRENTLLLSLNDFRVLSRDIALHAVNLYVSSTTGTSAPGVERTSPSLLSTASLSQETEGTEGLPPSPGLPASPGTINSDDLILT